MNDKMKILKLVRWNGMLSTDKQKIGTVVGFSS